MIDRWMKRNGGMESMIYAPNPAPCKRSLPLHLAFNYSVLVALSWTASLRHSVLGQFPSESPTPNLANSVGSPTSVAMGRLSPLGLSPGIYSPAPPFSKAARLLDRASRLSEYLCSRDRDNASRSHPSKSIPPVKVFQAASDSRLHTTAGHF